MKGFWNINGHSPNSKMTGVTFKYVFKTCILQHVKHYMVLIVMYSKNSWFKCNNLKKRPEVFRNKTFVYLTAWRRGTSFPPPPPLLTYVKLNRTISLCKFTLYVTKKVDGFWPQLKKGVRKVVNIFNVSDWHRIEWYRSFEVFFYPHYEIDLFILVVQPYLSFYLNVIW